jgi:hypothetical protein
VVRILLSEHLSLRLQRNRCSRVLPSHERRSSQTRIQLVRLRTSFPEGRQDHSGIQTPRENRRHPRRHPQLGDRMRSYQEALQDHQARARVLPKTLPPHSEASPRPTSSRSTLSPQSPQAPREILRLLPKAHHHHLRSRPSRARLLRGVLPEGGVRVGVSRKTTNFRIIYSVFIKSLIQ